MDLKTIGYGALGVGIVGLIFFGKYKLASSGAVWWALILGGVVFAISTPALTQVDPELQIAETAQGK